MWGKEIILKLDGDVYMPVYVCSMSECHSVSFLPQ